MLGECTGRVAKRRHNLRHFAGDAAAAAAAARRLNVSRKLTSLAARLLTAAPLAADITYTHNFIHLLKRQHNYTQKMKV